MCMLGIHVALWHEIFYAIPTNILVFYFRQILRTHNHAHRYLFAGTLQLKMFMKVNLVIQRTVCRHIVLEWGKFRLKIFTLSANSNRAVSLGQKSSPDKIVFLLLMVNDAVPEYDFASALVAQSTPPSVCGYHLLTFYIS